MKFRILSLFLALIGLTVGKASAQTNVTPNLCPGPVFSVDRYAPPSFTLCNSYQGRSDVLAIGINHSSDLTARAGTGQNYTFYNTQGMGTNVSANGSWTFSSDLFVERAWATPTNGYVRTDIWGVAIDPTNTVSAYPIIGFTNFGDFVGFRGYNTNSGAWINFTSTSVLLGAWNSLGMAFDASTDSFSYFVNGSLVSSFAEVLTDGFDTWPATSGANRVMYQAYNFNDPSLGVSGNPAYTVGWSNTPSEVVPEPATMSLLATGLVSLAGLGIRRRKHQA